MLVAASAYIEAEDDNGCPERFGGGFYVCHSTCVDALLAGANVDWRNLTVTVLAAEE